MKFITLITLLTAISMTACSTGVTGSLGGATVGANGTLVDHGTIIGGAVTATTDNTKR